MAKKMIPAINESELDVEKPESPRRVWIKEHMTAIYIGAAILLIIAVFVGIRIYNSANHPIAKFMSASAKDFNSSFTFEAEASVDGKTVMSYSGAYEADPSKQNVEVIYDADYGDYTYTGAVYAEGETRVSGSLYDGKWRVRDCSEKVLNFFDFNTDYRAGSFDGASFLRFTELTSQFSAKELNSFMKLFKDRMSGSTALARLTVTSQNGEKTYSFDISVSEFFDLVRDKGASIFFSAIDYDAFCALYELNESAVKSSDCRFSYTIDSKGSMTALSLSLTVGGETYAVSCKIDDVGSTKVDIPRKFFEALVAQQ